MSIELNFELDHPGFALRVALSLPGRGVTALFGPSGCGKTSILRCMAGLERAPRGRLVVNGEVWQDERQFLATHQRALGYVFQEANLFAHLSVRANLDYGRARIPREQRAGDFDHLVGLLGIAHLLARKPASLSGGERQRVAIARALLTRPRLLLMDEPLAALDQARRNDFLPYLERLRDELDIPVVYVSHAAEEVARLADHIVVLEAGSVVAAGPLREVLTRVELPVRLGEDAGAVLEGRVLEIDTVWHLARVEFAGGSLWVRDGGYAVGRAVRVRVLARDVSIALEPVSGTSIQNCLPATVVAMANESHPALALLRLDLGGVPLVARITRRSADRLGLVTGMAVWAQIKAVAVIA